MNPNISVALGGIIVAGVVYAIIGIIVIFSGYKWIDYLLPPVVTGAVVGLATAFGLRTRALAPVKKTIYSLIDLREILLACNRRYLAHLSALDDFSAGVRALQCGDQGDLLW